MSTLDEQIAELQQAIASGVRRVTTQSNGVKTEVEYQSTKDMQAALDRLIARRSGRSKTILVEF